MCELVFIHKESGKFARLAKPAKFDEVWMADLFLYARYMCPPPGLEWCKVYDPKILNDASDFNELINIAKKIDLGKNYILMLRNKISGETKHPYREVDYYGDKETAEKFSKLVQPEDGYEWIITNS